MQTAATAKSVCATTTYSKHQPWTRPATGSAFASQTDPTTTVSSPNFTQRAPSNRKVLAEISEEINFQRLDDIDPRVTDIRIRKLISPSPQSPSGPESAPSAEFAPNAFARAPSYPSAPSFGDSRWYDRILDALLGEDETSSKNRFALICSKCRLVNGQAPPGAKSLEDVGIWRCSGCGAMNGKESEASKVVKLAQAAQREPVVVKTEPEVGEEFAPSDSE